MKKRFIIVAIVAVFALAFSAFIKSTYDATESRQDSEGTTLNPQGVTTSDIIIDHPQSGEKVSLPLSITGRAKAEWFPGGSFDVYVQDARGVVIASGTAQAKGYTFTQHYIPFTVTLDYTSGSGVPPVGRGYIIAKSSAGGLIDPTKVIPIRF